MSAREFYRRDWRAESVPVQFVIMPAGCRDRLAGELRRRPNRLPVDCTDEGPMLRTFQLSEQLLRVDGSHDRRPDR